MHLDSVTVQPTLPRFHGIYGCEEIKRISRGAFGDVYLVRMTQFEKHKKAALKVFNAAADACFNVLSCEREKTVLRHIAIQEKMTGTRLQIAHIREDIHGVHCPNLMLEYIDGFDLNDEILSAYPFEKLFHFVASMLKQIGDGVLSALHQMNIFHNDLKPANIMFSTIKQLFYLLDLGLSVPLALLDHSVSASQYAALTMSCCVLDLLMKNTKKTRNEFRMNVNNNGWDIGSTYRHVIECKNTLRSTSQWLKQDSIS